MNGTVVSLPLAIPGIDAWHLAPHTGGEHRCYFCQPDTFPPMPQGCTLCSRCGVFIYTGTDDPMNEGMSVCTRCDEEMSGR